MLTVRTSLLAAFLATNLLGVAIIGAAPKKNIETRDTELRLMAMLFVSMTTPR